MIIVQMLGYMYDGVTTFETPAKRTLHKFVLKVHANKEIFFVDCFVSEFQIEYLKNAQRSTPLLVYGELQATAYMTKENSPKTKLSLYVKGMKLVREPAPAEQKEIPMQEFLW